MYVIGTAGHVDHGKSTLVKALTDIDPDRLPQEREREMTIELGFAWLTLPSGREVSIVDVPGHERFIKNMLAGVGGMDLALLIVAADESVMPQTREHLAILDILRVKRGLVVITKSDLVDEELLELVKEEVEEVLKGTTFEGSPIVSVSAYTGQGLDNFQGVLDSMLDSTETRRDLGRPRLPVDRVFTVAGFGTVVTGTLIDGSLSVGQDVQLALSGKQARIRGLQTHKQKVQEADPGRRLAVNLSGISKEDLERGELVTTPNWLQPTTRLDASLKLVRDAPRPLKHNEGLTIHVYTSEAQARVRLLDKERLEPGEEGLAQIHLKQPLPAVKGDLFVVRSSDTTLGGGEVLDAHPTRRHKRFVTSVIQHLEAMKDGTGDGSILNAVQHWGPCDLKTLARRANLSLDEILSGTQELVQKGDAILLGEDSSSSDATVFSVQAWQSLTSDAVAALDTYHKQHPLRKGLPKEELRSRLRLNQHTFPSALRHMVKARALEEVGALVRSPHHHVELSQDQQKRIDQYISGLEAEPYSPPTERPLDTELLSVLIEEGKVIKANESVVFAASAYKEMSNRVVEYIQEHGKIRVGDGRDLFGTSRKYMLPLLEYMDQQRITRRVGDERVLR